MLAPMSRALIPCGIRLALPPGFEAQVRPRSGLAAKNGVTLVNSPGTIDADYRGEIGVILVNETQLWGMVVVALMSIFMVNRQTRAEEERERVLVHVVEHERRRDTGEETADDAA